MIWFILFLSFLSPIAGMGHQRRANKRKLTYRLPNAFSPEDADNNEFRACTFQVTPQQFDQISAMSNSFAQHVKDESVYLEPDVQHLFNRMQQKDHHKKPTKTHEEIAQKIKKEHIRCKSELAALMDKLSQLESRTDDLKYQELDLLEKKITKLTREFMTLSHASNLHFLHTTKKRIEKISRERMNRRLSSLFSLLETTQKQMEDAEILP